MKRIALTGGNGFIGRYVVRDLLAHDFAVTCLGRSEAALTATPEGADKRLSDFSPESAGEALRDCDALLHLAGRRSLREDDPELVTPFAMPGLGMLDGLLRAAKANGLRRVVQASSIAVYSSHNTRPFREDEAPIPANPYGLVKCFCEQQLDFWSRRNGISVAHLRVSACYGHGERDTPVLMHFVNQAARGETLTIKQGGTHSIDQIYIADVAVAARAALLSDSSGPFNIGAGRSFSVREIAETVNTVFGNNGNLSIEGDEGEAAAPPYPRNYMLIERAHTLLGWAPAYSLRAGLGALRDAREKETTP